MIWGKGSSCLGLRLVSGTSSLGRGGARVGHSVGASIVQTQGNPAKASYNVDWGSQG